MIERDRANLIYQTALDSDNEQARSLFHYTSTEVLDILLNNSTFRASNIFYLNDSEEFSAGIKALKKIKWLPSNAVDEYILENARGELSPGVYTISFSKKQDLLSQWITYAKEAGVSLELDGKLIENSRYYRWYGIEKTAETKIDGEAKILDHIYFFLPNTLHSVKYSVHEGEINMTTKEPLNVMKRKEMILWMASYIKNNSFAAEEEIRISVLPGEYYKADNEKIEAEIKYHRMGSRGVLRPYVDVTFGYTKNNGTGIFYPCLPLKTIMVGPAGNQQAVFDSIVHRIKYGKTNVFDYSRNKSLLKNNIYDYIVNIIQWLGLNEFAIVDEGIKKEEKRKRTIDRLIESYIPDVKDNVKDNGEDNRKLVVILLTHIVAELEKRLKIQVDFNYRDNEIKSEHQRILNMINDNFYFSTKGLMIKKSEIPYIF